MPPVGVVLVNTPVSGQPFAGPVAGVGLALQPWHSVGSSTIRGPLSLGENALALRHTCGQVPIPTVIVLADHQTILMALLRCEEQVVTVVAVLGWFGRPPWPHAKRSAGHFRHLSPLVSTLISIVAVGDRYALPIQTPIPRYTRWRANHRLRPSRGDVFAHP